MKKKVRQSQQINRRYKEESNGHFRTEKKIKMKNSLDRLNSIMEETQKRSSELEDIKI